MKTTLDITMYLFAILGGFISIREIYLLIKPLRKISWRRVERGVLRIKEEFDCINYHPTLIVGIGRGGAVVGALLSGTLHNVPILVIDREYDWTNKERKDSFFEEIRVSKHLEKVLLVAGELHSGNTAKKYKEYFSLLGAKEIKMFAFMKNPYSTCPPDFSCISTENSKIRFPWMITKNYIKQSIENRNAKQHNLPNI